MNRLKEKFETLKQQMRRLEGFKVGMLATPDHQISLVDPDGRSIATSGHGLASSTTTSRLLSIQSHPGHEHHGHRAAHRRDEGLVT
jgi:hypothetical protein